MNQLKNSVRLIGNAGQDPELKTLDNGRKLARLSIATSEKYKNNSGKIVDETYWHNLVIWGKQAEFAEKHIAKGERIAIEGKLTSRDYTSKDGQKRSVTEIVVNEILLLGARKPSEAPANDENDLPF